MTSRRSVLGGAGVATLALPFLRLLERPAQAATAPKRIIFFATPNGTNLTTYWPTAWSGFPEILKPLEPMKQKLLVMRGIDSKTSEKKDSSGALPRNHALSYPDLLTGWQPPVGTASTYGGPVDLSLDQAIANSIGGQTQFKSLQLGVGTSKHTGFWLLSAGQGQIMFPENSPTKMHDRLFAALMPQVPTGPDPMAVKRLANRKSMLDFVKDDLTRLRCALGSEERPKFDAHLGAVRDLENQLAFTVKGAGAGCQKPVMGTATDFRTTGKNQMDILVRALACDLTRVGVIQWSSGASDIVYDWLGMTAGHHNIAHRLGGMPVATAAAMTTKIENWYASQFFYLCDQLDRITDVDGRTLLDNTAVVWTHEQQEGASHNMRDMPWVIAGSCGGFFSTGKAVPFKGVAHNRMLVTLARAMGMQVNSFGDPDFAGPPLAEIMA